MHQPAPCQIANIPATTCRKTQLSQSLTLFSGCSRDTGLSLARARKLTYKTCSGLYQETSRFAPNSTQQARAACGPNGGERISDKRNCAGAPILPFPSPTKFSATLRRSSERSGSKKEVKTFRLHRTATCSGFSRTGETRKPVLLITGAWL